MSEGPRLRIGELSQRVGASPELLRAWETRYGLLRPERSEGGLRLYTEDDERLVRLMRQHIAAGLSASEAARLAKLGSEPPSRDASARLPEIVSSLEHGFEALDEPAAHAALDDLFGAVAIDSALTDVLLPFLRRLGERWAAAQVSAAQEHFASNVIGGRLRALARGWGRGVGPRAVLACPPGEQHELGLLCFGLALRELGWRITYFGAQTPLGDIADVLAKLSPTIVVLSAVAPQPFLDAGSEITALTGRVRVAIGGAGATAPLAQALGVEWLREDIVGAAAALTT